MPLQLLKRLMPKRANSIGSDTALEQLLVKVNEALPKLQGWCSPEKAACLVKYIQQEKPAICVELGVFGGSSLVPQLMALQFNGTGCAHGVDPWSVDAALENMHGQENRDWWSTVNLEAVYQQLVSYLQINGLDSFCTLHREKSETAAEKFKDESIGLLHIDGNHSEPQSFTDAKLYLPKVKRGGIVFFDDISWTDSTNGITTKRAIMYMLEHCTRLEIVGDCMVLRRN